MGGPEEAAFLRAAWKLGTTMGLKLSLQEPAKRDTCLGVVTP